MKFYHVSRPLHLETDASGISVRAGLLWVREGMNCGCGEGPDNVVLCLIVFASKCSSSAEWWYNSIKWEGLGIPHGLEKFHLYFLSK